MQYYIIYVVVAFVRHKVHTIKKSFQLSIDVVIFPV